MELGKLIELSLKFLHKSPGKCHKLRRSCNVKLMVKLETKFWHEVKKNTSQIVWTRIENTGTFGTPDLLGYNKNHFFFTVELKVTRSNKIRFSPHQIAFHITHPINSFILVKHLGPCTVKLYSGSAVRKLDACGLKLEPLCLGLEACGLMLSKLGA